MFWKDVRFGLRMLRRDPAFTAVAAVTGLAPARHATRLDPLLALRDE